AKKPIFFHDINGYFCSADVYIASLKNDKLVYENIVKYLNSRIFHFICSIELKKVGQDLYEFYPYSLKKLPIINKKYLIDHTLYGYIQYEEYLNNIFNLNKEEINIINSTI
ncbi:MAG: TaqI-like C-terminal specificity domain-containing protein, partial [Bacillota bacterium]|nr:TaqI-like C-terminal specificity domain-containing protein [Bacillota bacterium]